jgi:P27 family predicted phage terminase small subunit
MKTGRPPKPTALKELAGNPGKRPLNHNEPKPAVIIPPCPKWLAGNDRRTYTQLAKQLVGLRVMTEVDGIALAELVHQLAKWLEAEKMVHAGGRVLVGEKGGYYLNPWESIANTALKNMNIMLREFGMTPASRSRIEAQPAEEQTQSLAEKLFAGVSIE